MPSYQTKDLNFLNEIKVSPVSLTCYREGRILSRLHVSGIAIAKGAKKPCWYYLHESGLWSTSVTTKEEYTGLFKSYFLATQALEAQRPHIKLAA